MHCKSLSIIENALGIVGVHRRRWPFTFRWPVACLPLVKTNTFRSITCNVQFSISLIWTAPIGSRSTTSDSWLFCIIAFICNVNWLLHSCVAAFVLAFLFEWSSSFASSLSSFDHEIIPLPQRYIYFNLPINIAEVNVNSFCNFPFSVLYLL